MWLTLFILYICGLFLALAFFQGASLLGESKGKSARDGGQQVLFQQLELPLSNSMNTRFPPFSRNQRQ